VDSTTRIRAREKDIALFIRGLDKFLFRNLDNILGDIETGSISGSEAAQVLGSLQTSLKQLGLTKELAKLQAIYATELRQVRETFNEIGFKGQIFSDTDKQVIGSLITFDTDKTATNINRYVDNVKSVVMQSVLSGENPKFGDIHDKFGNSLEGVLDTELNTSLAAFDRAVTAKKAEDLGIELFIYQGPTDKITRPFCRHLLDKSPAIYTIDDIKAMDNETGLDVLTYGGGYNCRHQWSPITKEKALELGYNGQ